MTNPVVKMPATTMPEMPVTPENRAEVLLQPIAAPSILGLYGFAAATFMVAAHIAHWYGSSNTELYLAPFAAVFGGLAQFLAGMWAFKARDALATAMHGMWGAFWIAYGILNLLFASGDLVRPNGAFPALGFWFIGLAAITWVGTAAAAAESKALTSVLAFLALGSTLFAIGQIGGNDKIDILPAGASSSRPYSLGTQQAELCCKAPLEKRFGLSEKPNERSTALHLTSALVNLE